MEYNTHTRYIYYTGNMETITLYTYHSTIQVYHGYYTAASGWTIEPGKQAAETAWRSSAGTIHKAPGDHRRGRSSARRCTRSAGRSSEAETETKASAENLPEIMPDIPTPTPIHIYTHIPIERTPEARELCRVHPAG